MLVVVLFGALHPGAPGDAAPEPERTRLFRWIRRVIPSVPRFDGHRSFTRENGRRVATPLLFALVVLELSDVLLAILALRSRSFLVAGLVTRCVYLKRSLAAVLMFAGAKMLVIDSSQMDASALAARRVVERS